jgi:hypothetical protein
MAICGATGTFMFCCCCWARRCALWARVSATMAVLYSRERSRRGSVKYYRRLCLDTTDGHWTSIQQSNTKGVYTTIYYFIIKVPHHTATHIYYTILIEPYLRSSWSGSFNTLHRPIAYAIFLTSIHYFFGLSLVLTSLSSGFLKPRVPVLYSWSGMELTFFSSFLEYYLNTRAGAL